MLIIPREICRNLDQALSREWLATNGLGGYASSSIVGANTRRYHGLLVTALAPPGARTVLLSKLDEEIEVNNSTYRLATNEYESGTIHPDGYLYLERVELDGMIPTFYYQAAAFALSKTIWMAHHRNTTYIRYTVAPDSPPLQLTLLPLCTYRDAAVHVRGSIDWHFKVMPGRDGVEIQAFPGAVPWRLVTEPSSEFVALDLWYWRFKHRVEQERGLDSVEDLYLPGLIRRRLEPGESFTVIVTSEAAAEVDRDAGAALESERMRQASLTQAARDDVERQLLLAADQFVVRYPVERHTQPAILAGYPWFGEWGRDTLISLEGLLLIPHRFAEAREILAALARRVDDGLIPKRFPVVRPGGESVLPEYGTVDTTLWFFHALDRYLAATLDYELLSQLYPTLVAIVDWHVRGTRFGIRVDPADGLLSAGQVGEPLTWMDAQAGESAVTPRIGKPVEINALWYRALRRMEEWAPLQGAPGAPFGDLARRVQRSFGRYWFQEGGYLYDVIDGPDGQDASLRPNQLWAVSLGGDLVSPEVAQSILSVVERELLTPCGLRTLAARDPRYRATYHGNVDERNVAYQQGLVWPWLIGAYVDACLALGHDPDAKVHLLDDLSTYLTQVGLGTLSEIYEAQSPYRPVGCMAQACSVAEVIRAYVRIKHTRGFRTRTGATQACRVSRTGLIAPNGPDGMS